MKRIGIITFHTVLNYGGVLQAVALYTFIKSLGLDVKLVDYHNAIFDKQSNPYARYGNIAKDTLRMLFFARKKQKLANSFSQFVSANTKLGERHDTQNIAHANNGFDVFITGSDQVFNLDITGQDKNFLLDFVLPGKTKMSYAASFGGYAIDRSLDSLKSFDRISVREEMSAKALTEKGIEASTHIDPTFLVGKEFWERVASTPCEKDYVLLYTLGHGPHVDKLVLAAERYAKAHKKKLLYINNGYKPFDFGISYKRRVSPQQFVGLFANADTVFTNSFHGTAFSVIFQRDFFVDSNLPQGKGGRIKNLFKVLGINDRQYDSTVNRNSIDWNVITKNIESERNRAKSYFTSVL